MAQFSKVTVGPTHSDADSLWLQLQSPSAEALWVGGCYIPGASDMRFRCLQGKPSGDQFDHLRTQLNMRSRCKWICGGDVNATTGVEQPAWDCPDPLDVLAPDVIPPSRTSMDERPISAHGRRFLSTLSGCALIFNGLVEKEFDNSFTRLPTRTEDCPGILDYIFGPPRMLSQLVHRSFKVMDSPPDFSDHCPVSVEILLHCAMHTDANEQNELFDKAPLRALKLPEDEETWQSLNTDLLENSQYQDLCSELRSCLSSDTYTKEDAQLLVTRTVEHLVSLLFTLFTARHLLKNRSFQNTSGSLPTNARHSAPPQLRSVRHVAAEAKKLYKKAVMSGASDSCIASAKKSWNESSAKCKKVCRFCKNQFCADWVLLWKGL